MHDAPALTDTPTLTWARRQVESDRGDPYHLVRRCECGRYSPLPLCGLFVPRSGGWIRWHKAAGLPAERDRCRECAPAGQTAVEL